MRFTDKTAIVAGGAGGLGKGVTMALLAEGAKVLVLSRKQESLDNLEKEAKNEGYEVSTMIADVTDYEATKAAVAAAVDKFGRLDIMVSAPGGGGWMPLIDITLEFWEYEIRYNFYTVFNCFHNALQVMVPQKFGRLLCFMSTTGGTPNLSAYGVAKASCQSLMESITAEHKKDNITANGLMPSFVPTPFALDSFDYPGGQELLDSFLANMPLGANTVENVTKTALNILDDARLSGQTISLG